MKSTKAAAHYGRGMKSAHCGICQHFIAPDQCNKVAGKISPQGWCRFFRKDATMALAPQTGDDAGQDDADATAATAADTGDTDAGGDDQSPEVLVSIAKDPQGGYLVFAGDEPDGDAGEGAAAPQHADSVGAALKLALDILNESEASAGEPGGSEDQFAAGFGMSKEPTPGMKYPPKARG
jgi:hypothetical protein